MYMFVSTRTIIILVWTYIVITNNGVIFTGFNNRKVCTIDEEYDLTEIQNNLNNNGFFTRDGKTGTLNNKIVLLQHYESENLNFSYGKFGFEMETETSTPEIRENGIFETSKEVIIPVVLSFWIADNGLILFNSLGDGFKKKGKSILSQYLFGNEGSIIENEFNINEITNAVEEGVLNNMWTSSFSGRQDNIHGGTFNGDDVNEDVMFNLAEDATKTVVGILYELYDVEIKLKFYNSGTVQLLTKEFEMNDPTMFNVLRDFSEYLI